MESYIYIMDDIVKQISCIWGFLYYNILYFSKKLNDAIKFSGIFKKHNINLIK